MEGNSYGPDRTKVRLMWIGIAILVVLYLIIW